MRDPKRQGPVRQAAGSCPCIAQTCVMIFGLNLLLAGIMKNSKMKQNRVKQISIVMAAADVVDNGLSVSRNSVPKAQEIHSLDKQVPA